MAAIKIMVTIEEKWLDAFRAAAQREDLPLSRWLAEAGRVRLPARVQRRLPEPQRPGRPAKTAGR